MGCLGVLFVAFGVFFLIYGLAAFWIPPVAIFFLVPGIVFVMLGLALRRKARQTRLRRQMGDRCLEKLF